MNSAQSSESIRRSRFGLEEIRQAAERIKPWAHRTPVMTSKHARCTLREPSVFLKCENFQRVGAFKFRGRHERRAAVERS